MQDGGTGTQENRKTLFICEHTFPRILLRRSSEKITSTPKAILSHALRGLDRSSSNIYNLMRESKNKQVRGVKSSSSFTYVVNTKGPEVFLRNRLHDVHKVL